MALKQQITADMAAFFNTDEFAEEATYTPSGWDTGQAINVILSSEASEREDGGTGKKLRRTASVTVKRADVATPGHGDTVTINSESWSVIDVIGQDDYTSTLHVERVKTIERTSPGHRVQ